MVTIAIIILTVAVSLLCFYGGLDLDRLKFSAHDVWHHRKWWQLVTYGFVHGGWGHLFFNMLTLYFFGRVVEQYFVAVWGEPLGQILYVVLYLTAIIVSSLQVQGRLELQRRGCFRGGIGHPVRQHTLRAEDGYLHLPYSHPGSRVYLRAAVPPVLLVYGKAQRRQYRPYGSLLGSGLRARVPAASPP